MKSDALITQTDASRKIDLLGGTRKVAEILDCGESDVSHWRRKGIPKYANLYLCLRFRKLFKAGGVL
jgi:hypothetical protein